jgi:hypothetical protein
MVNLSVWLVPESMAEGGERSYQKTRYTDLKK